MRYSILSLFPGMFRGFLDESIIGKAREKGLIDVELIDIRDFAEGRHRTVDDRPYGGGPGMVMMAEPVVRAIESVKGPTSKVVFLTPKGERFTATKARALAGDEHLILLCGHYEGIDQRVIDSFVDEEISIGDYVVTNGCLPAAVLVDAISRFLPGVVGHEEAANQDSHEGGAFDCPHYTRPEVFRGQSVPEVLLTGHHKKIEEWRRHRAEEKKHACNH